MSHRALGGQFPHQTGHRPPDPEYGASMDNPEAMFPGDLKYYRTYHHSKARQETPDLYAEEPQTLNTLNDARGNPDMGVIVHRAVPHGVTEIHPGDWVTPTRSYAEQHRESNLPEGEGVILSRKVRAGDLYTEGNSIHEWGWNPR